MATKDTLSALVQKVGLNKAVKLLGVKGVGPATYQKIAAGDLIPNRSVVSTAPRAANIAEQQIQLRENKELAKRIGFEKVLKRAGQTIPTTKSSLREIEQFNKTISQRPISRPSVFRLTSIPQSKLSRLMVRYSIDPNSIRFQDRKVVATTTDGDKMYLVYLDVPKRRGREKDWYFTPQENINAYKAFKQGRMDALYNIWDNDDVYLHEFATDARG